MYKYTTFEKLTDDLLSTSETKNKIEGIMPSKRQFAITLNETTIKHLISDIRSTQSKALAYVKVDRSNIQDLIIVFPHAITVKFKVED